MEDFEIDKKSGFDRLVAGLSSEERTAMLARINMSAPDSVQIPEPEAEPDKTSIRLSLKLKGESFIYRFFIWLRSFLSKASQESIYNDDILASLAKRINRNSPGLLNLRINALDYLFFERLKDLKAAADFFRPYFMYVNENPGDFYVFLSSFIAPELSEKINSEVDPFNLSFMEEPTNDVRNGLMKKLDEALKNMSTDVRNRIYSAVTASCWLEQFSQIPFIHFMAQFTNVSGDLYTSQYKNAQTDYNILADVFANMVMVQNEVVEALFLFSQRKGLSKSSTEADIERAVKDFMGKASSHFSAIKSFASSVPVVKIGKIVNNDYEWVPGNIEGAESWFTSFKARWKKIIDLRWQEWLKERKKHFLGQNLHDDFGLTDFPLLPDRPWASLWSKNQFQPELTGGFLGWFVNEKFDDVAQPLSDLMMEGIFIRNDNRTEYSEALNEFIIANSEIQKLMNQLSPSGEYGMMFEEFTNQKARTFQIQNQIDSLLSSFEATVKKSLKDFSESVRKINGVFHGIFDETKDGIHEGLQNFSTIKGRGNHQFRDNLLEIRDLLRKCVYYLSELEPIDSAINL